VSLFHPAYTVPPVKLGGFEHTIQPNRWWHPGDRRKAKRVAFILEALRHPAAREALQESGNRKERRGSKVAPGQLERQR
jgi:hypothetical protein